MVKHNYLAILIMTIVQMGIGFIWYGLLFAEPWAQAAFGKSVAELQATIEFSPIPYVVNIIGAACTCFFLSWLVLRLGLTTFGDGFRLGLYSSVGLVIPAVATHYLFLDLSKTALAIDLGMSSVAIILTGCVLSVWRRK
jgi:hypothetical protein